jgi:DNA-binding response OmpR family regulator
MENKKRKILIVDDDEDLKALYEEVFQNANFEVVLASDGLEGLDIATKQMPDIIFTGIVMPRMDGFSMIESLKKTVMTSSIPVIISSHMGREEDKIKAEQYGAKDFIVRGTTRPVEVVERINALFTEAGGSYRIGFDPFYFDAQKLAKDLNFEVGFKCLDCGEKMMLDLKLTDSQKHLFEAKFICPKCGSAVK